MLYIRDLQLEENIIPFFDYTHNMYAKQELSLLFDVPLKEDAILERQHVIKGFIANQELLKKFSYSSLDLSEVHAFTNSPGYANAIHSSRRLTAQLIFQREFRQRAQSRITQTILLFFRLHTLYLGPIKSDVFPASYKKELSEMNTYLYSFDLPKYEGIFREGRWKATEIITVLKKIKEHEISGRTKIFWQQFFRFEAFLSVGLASYKHGFVFPVFNTGPMVLENFYHPLLKQPVSNSFTSQHPLLLLTGANMSGKSTLLKSLALCIYLAHLGFPVPASACSLPYFDSFLVSLQHRDDLQKGYSHFLSEVKLLKELAIELREGKKCFAVFDELFNATTVEDALEIMDTTLCGLINRPGSFFAIATHLHALRSMPEVQQGKMDTFFLQCSVVDQMPQFTYRIERGWSDLKIGRILFRNEGLNELLAPQSE